MQKSGTRDNNCVKWKGTFRSDRPKWRDRSKWTTFKLVPNIPVGPNRNGPFHLMCQPKFPEFWVKWKAPLETLVSAVRVERIVEPEGEKGGGLAPSLPPPPKQAWEAHEPGDLGIQWPRDPEIEIWNKTKRSNNPVYRQGTSLVHLTPSKPLKEYFKSNVKYTSITIWHSKF